MAWDGIKDYLSILDKESISRLKNVALGIALAFGGLLLVSPASVVYGFERVDWSHDLEEDEKAREYVKELSNDSSFWRWKQPVHGRDFMANNAHPRRVSMVSFINSGQKMLVGLVKFGPDCEGPPHVVHGGCTAMLIDASLATLVQALRSIPCFTGTFLLSLTVNLATNHILRSELVY